MAKYRYQGEPGPKKTRMGLNVKPAPDLNSKLKSVEQRTQTFGTMRKDTVDKKTGTVTKGETKPLTNLNPKNANSGSFRGNSTQSVVKSTPKTTWKKYGKTGPVGGSAGKASLLQAGGKF